MNDYCGRNGGMSGGQYDRYVQRYDESTLSRLKQQYWEAKQTFLHKIKRKEDDCIVASDAELDAKLELFRSIEESCYNLIVTLEGYQDRVCGLAHEEAATGRFLKECGKVDKTRAGKMMTATGKTLSYTAQQRIQLRNPLVRLYQEVETFQYRAVADTMVTIDKMEKARTAYRGALLWMKDVSQQLDPDTYKQLDKFRKVQAHVRRSKARFDKIKLDTLQKVDLLTASRCNMYSHALAGYQNAILTFWEKTSRTMTAVADSFKGYQFYEFNMLKELTETSKALADSQEKTLNEDLLKIFEETEEDDKDRMTFFDAEYHDDLRKDKKDGKNMKDKSKLKKEKKSNSEEATSTSKQMKANEDSLLDFGSTSQSQNDSLKAKENKVNTPAVPKNIRDLLTVSEMEADDLTMLNEILNMPNTPVIQANQSHSQKLLDSHSNEFLLPSQLMDLNQSFTSLNLYPITNPNATSQNQLPAKTSTGTSKKPKDKVQTSQQSQASSKSNNKDMSSWFNLFADLDPLANPDAVGKKDGEVDDRNC